jgi:hypothetical protein
MIKRFNLVYILLFFLLSSSLSAQKVHENKNKEDAGLITGFSYGYFFPGGDLEKRFGNSFKVDISPAYYFYNSSFSIGFEFGYLFGSEVKINPLSNLISYDDQIISIDKTFALLSMDERGYKIGINIGKIVSFNDNIRSGLKLELGIGFLRHWIHYQKDYGILPQLEGEYLKGYDRLTGGISTKEFIGYQHLKKDSKINFYVGFEFIQGFTKSLRKYNYDHAVYDLEQRNDYLFGFKIGWILPLYKVNNPDEIFY